MSILIHAVLHIKYGICMHMTYYSSIHMYVASPQTIPSFSTFLDVVNLVLIFEYIQDSFMLFAVTHSKGHSVIHVYAPCQYSVLPKDIDWANMPSALIFL